MANLPPQLGLPPAARNQGGPTAATYQPPPSMPGYVPRQAREPRKYRGVGIIARIIGVLMVLGGLWWGLHALILFQAINELKADGFQVRSGATPVAWGIAVVGFLWLFVGAFLVGGRRWARGWAIFLFVVSAALQGFIWASAAQDEGPEADTFAASILITGSITVGCLILLIMDAVRDDTPPIP